MQNGSIKSYPKDPFQHASSLIDTDKVTVQGFQNLLNELVLLCNLSETTMRFYQTDIFLLTQLYGMSRRDSELEELFLTTYYGWLAEISMTRTKDGAERKYQASVNQYSPKEMLYGFGAEQLQEAKKEEENKTLIDKILKR